MHERRFGCLDVICIPLSNCRWYLCHILGTAGPGCYFSFLLVVSASENKLTSVLCAYLFLFVVSPQQLLNPLAHFNHILQRKVELLGIVSCSNLLENRRGNVLCTSEGPCCMLALGKVQTGNWVLLLLLILELLVSHGLPSLVLRVWPLISANKDKNHKLKCIPWVCYLHVPYKIKDTSRDSGGGWGIGGFYFLPCGKNGSRIHLLLRATPVPFSFNFSTQCIITGMLSDHVPWRCFSVVKIYVILFFFLFWEPFLKRSSNSEVAWKIRIFHR